MNTTQRNARKERNVFRFKNQISLLKERKMREKGKSIIEEKKEKNGITKYQT